MSDANKQQLQHVLLGITGSIAAVKGPEIAVRLVKEVGVEVKVLLTKGGSNFWEKAKDYDKKHWDELQSLLNTKSSKITIFSHDSEWNGWNKLGDPVLHIDLRDWADLMVLAPLSAHTLAKIAHGFCDDTLSCILRAWDFGHHDTRPAKPIILAPAMNTAMWQHPLTNGQLDTICGFEATSDETEKIIRVVKPVVKKLACGEIGQGALATVDEILKAVKDSLHR